MDNCGINKLIIATSVQTFGLMTLWGLTTYFDKSSEPEIPMLYIRLFGRRVVITNKIFYKMSFLTSIIVCVNSSLRLNKEL